MAEELKKEQDSSSLLERMKRNMEATVKGLDPGRDHHPDGVRSPPLTRQMLDLPGNRNLCLAGYPECIVL